MVACKKKEREEKQGLSKTAGQNREHGKQKTFRGGKLVFHRDKLFYSAIHLCFGNDPSQFSFRILVAFYIGKLFI